MIFHNNKLNNNRSSKASANPESGVTLLLALLILGGMTAIAFSLAAIMFIEIRSSSDLQRSEPGLFVTQGILEEAIFKTKRIVPDSEISNDGCPGTGTVSLSCGLNNVEVETVINAANPSGSTTETILPDSIDYATTPNVYYLIDATNPFLDSNEDGSPDGDYGRVKITNTGQTGTHADIQIGVCILDDTDCIGTGIWDEGPQTLTPGSSVTWDLDNLLAYQINIINNTGGSSVGFAKIESFGPGVTTPKGLPYFGKRLIEVSATYLGLTRKYNALVPTQ